MSVDKRSDCLTRAERTTTLEQALSDCQQLKYGIPEEMCIAEVQTGQMATVEAQGIAICDDMLSAATAKEISTCLQIAKVPQESSTSSSESSWIKILQEIATP